MLSYERLHQGMSGQSWKIHQRICSSTRTYTHTHTRTHAHTHTHTHKRTRKCSKWVVGQKMRWGCAKGRLKIIPSKNSFAPLLGHNQVIFLSLSHIQTLTHTHTHTESAWAWNRNALQAQMQCRRREWGLLKDWYFCQSNKNKNQWRGIRNHKKQVPRDISISFKVLSLKLYLKNN